MRLGAIAESKKKLGYLVDWLKVSFTENGIDKELTLDVNGSIEYNEDKLDCCCKGQLVPWMLSTSDEELDYSAMNEEELSAMFPESKILEIIRKGTNFILGIYPVDDTVDLDDEEISKGYGFCEIYDGNKFCEAAFEFYAEINM